MDRDELLRTITTAHDELLELVARISDERLLDPAINDWTGKDVLAHLAWWQEHSAKLTEDLRTGQQPDEKTHPGSTTDEINDYVYREHVLDPPERARGAFAQTFERLLASIETLTDGELFESDRCPWLNGGAVSEMILGDTSRHYQDHFAHLEPLQSAPARESEVGS